MAYKRYGRKRKFSRKFKRMSRRKRTYARRIPRPVKSLKADYTAVLRSNTFEFANDSLVETKGGYTFALANMINFGQFVQMFDQYRIKWVRCTFRPVLTTVVNRPYDDTTAGSAVNQIPKLVTCIDRDDITSAFTYYELKTKQGARENLATKTVSFKFVPNRLVMVYVDPVTTGYKIDSEANAWIDCANNNVPHYGLKYALEVATPKDAYQYEFTWHAMVQFRSRRQ